MLAERVWLRREGFFFFTLVTGPRRSLSLNLSDTRVYEPQIRARLGAQGGRFGPTVGHGVFHADPAGKAFWENGGADHKKLPGVNIERCGV